MQRFLCALALATSVALPAWARDPTGQWSNSPYHNWFANAENKLGEPCCAKSDAHVLENGDWRMTRNEYEARIDARWYSIDQNSTRLRQSDRPCCRLVHANEQRSGHFLLQPRLGILIKAESQN